MASLFSKIFQNKAEIKTQQFFKTFNAYIPQFTTWGGALYESERVRAAVDARARHNAKLRVELRGPARPKLKTAMQFKPNGFQTWSQFLYRLSTILDMQNTAFIVPVFNEFMEQTGIYCVLPSRCSIIEHNGTEYLRYTFTTGDVGAVEMSRCGIMTKFQYKDDFFGEGNNGALKPTMDLIHINHQGIKEGVKNSASFRFAARLTNFLSDEDLAKEQKRFTETSMAPDAGGVLIFPNNLSDIQQVDSKPFTVNAEEMKLIDLNIYNYFGVNEKILQNMAMGTELDAFYEGAIEPFSIQLSEVLTNMIYSQREKEMGSQVLALANRLQYMTTADKVNFIREMGDRGYITINEGRDLLNFPLLPADVGDLRPIRGEYYLQDADGNIVKKDGDNNE